MKLGRVMMSLALAGLMVPSGGCWNSGSGEAGPVVKEPGQAKPGAEQVAAKGTTTVPPQR